jgi:hypothetical protein
MLEDEVISLGHEVQPRALIQESPISNESSRLRTSWNSNAVTAKEARDRFSALAAATSLHCERVENSSVKSSDSSNFLLAPESKDGGDPSLLGSFLGFLSDSHNGTRAAKAIERSLRSFGGGGGGSGEDFDVLRREAESLLHVDSRRPAATRQENGFGFAGQQFHGGDGADAPWGDEEPSFGRRVHVLAATGRPVGRIAADVDSDDSDGAGAAGKRRQAAAATAAAQERSHEFGIAGRAAILSRDEVRARLAALAAASTAPATAPAAPVPSALLSIEREFGVAPAATAAGTRLRPHPPPPLTRVGSEPQVPCSTTMPRTPAAAAGGPSPRAPSRDGRRGSAAAALRHSRFVAKGGDDAAAAAAGGPGGSPIRIPHPPAGPPPSAAAGGVGGKVPRPPSPTAPRRGGPRGPRASMQGGCGGKYGPEQGGRERDDAVGVGGKGDLDGDDGAEEADMLMRRHRRAALLRWWLGKVCRALAAVCGLITVRTRRLASAC